MKSIRSILAVLFATLLVSGLSFAAEPEVERHMEIKIAADDEVISFDPSDMEVGDTRQEFTESGKEVVVTRTEEGFQLEVDGKEIDVDMPHGHHAIFNLTGDGDRKVVIHKLHGDGGHGHGYHYVHGAEGEDVDVVIERASAADHLAESGVLDDLDEAKRQEILDTLRQMHRLHKQVRVRVDKEVDEE